MTAGELPVESYEPPSGYTFRRGTLKELPLAYNYNRYTFWLNIFIAVYMGVFSIHTCLQAGIKSLHQIQKAYLFEYGKLPDKLTATDWQQILSSAGLTALAIIPWIALIIIIGLISHVIFKKLIEPKEPTPAMWVVCYQEQIVGRVVTLESVNYSILSFLFINPYHRGQNLGSYLVWKCLQDVRKPVYLTCFPSLQSFYSRLGFVDVPKQDFPKELRSFKMARMGLFQAPIAVAKSTVFPMPSGISMLPICDFNEQWQVYKQFWRRQRFRQVWLDFLASNALGASLTFVLANLGVWVLKVVFGIRELFNYDFYLLGIQLSVIAIAVWLLSLLLVLWIVSPFWQQWVIKQSDSATRGASDRPIGYIHVSSLGDYSVLYNLHIEPQSQPLNLSKLLLARVSRTIALPLYVNSHRDRQLYTRLGFTVVSRNELPLEMRMQLGNHQYLKFTQQAATNLLAELADISQSLSTNQISVSSSRSEQVSQNRGTPRQTEVQKRKLLKRVLIGVGVILLIAYTISPLFTPLEIPPALQEQIKHRHR